VISDFAKAAPANKAAALALSKRVRKLVIVCLPKIE
jgi:hypothetical protein